MQRKVSTHLSLCHRAWHAFPAALMLIALVSWSPARADNVAASACNSLQKLDFSSTQDALIEIIQAEAREQQSICEVTGYIAPSITFLLKLPLRGWNGKLLQLGCGGACGTTDHAVMCQLPLQRGYACIVSDGGHRSTVYDYKWARNNYQALFDYLVRAPNVTSIAGKAIADKYYGRHPSKSYFMGCSGGGVQAMNMAQRFPWSFDGIIAGGPALSFNRGAVNQLWAIGAMNGENANDTILKQEALELLHRSVVETCDLNDGVRDGLIGDPRQCSFDPAALSCTGKRGSKCLTPLQVQAAKKIYKGPATASGTSIFMPSALYGSELTWSLAFTNTAVVKATEEAFRSIMFQPNPAPTWALKDFDFDRDYQRMGIAESLEPANPDLRRFKAAGGKLIMYTGWNDVFETPLRTVDYYETSERVIGGSEQTRDFFRLFVVPGMNHCQGGEGASEVDWLSYLERWVEERKAPDRIEGVHRNPDGSTAFTRPVFPYPTQAKYLGVGDPSLSASFGPSDPDRVRVAQPEQPATGARARSSE